MASTIVDQRAERPVTEKVGEIEMRVALDAALLADASKWLTVQATRPNPHRPRLAKPTRIGINQSPVPGQGTSEEALHRLNKALHVYTYRKSDLLVLFSLANSKFYHISYSRLMIIPYAAVSIYPLVRR